MRGVMQASRESWRAVAGRVVGVFVAGLTLTTPVAAAVCRAESGAARTPLVELYTSEGCSSCPPADRALSALARTKDVVPLALHVDYWDSLGWKDRFGQPAFAARQAWEVHANGERTSFTPHFFVDGAELEDWRADLLKRVRKADARAPAHVSVTAEPDGPGRLRVRVAANDVSGAHGPLALVAVVTDSDLSSEVKAGENRGVHLAHDAVARYWLGESPVVGNQATLERVLDVPELPRGRIAVVAFVQDRHNAEVLQAVTTGFCKPD